VSFSIGGNLIWSIIAIIIGLITGRSSWRPTRRRARSSGAADDPVEAPVRLRRRCWFGCSHSCSTPGFNIFNTVLAGNAIAGALHLGSGADPFWFWHHSSAAVVAIFGYDLILGWTLSHVYVTVIVLGLLTLSALASSVCPPKHWTSRSSTRSHSSRIGVVAGYQDLWAIYGVGLLPLPAPDTAT
jgi:hypothetical protein